MPGHEVRLAGIGECHSDVGQNAGHGIGRFDRLDRPHEPIATAWNGLDERGVRGVVAERAG